MRPIRSTIVYLNADATITLKLLYDGIAIQEINLKIDEWHENLPIIAQLMIQEKAPGN